MGEHKNRPTIGLLVSGIMDTFTKSICHGVMQAVHDADMNLVVFPGKYLDRDLTKRREIMYEYQYSTVFSYPRKESIDALIVAAGSISCYTTEERMKELLGEYADIPCVLVASKIEGYVSINYDNAQGIIDGIEYLIQKKNCKNFGMIGGYDSNIDSHERKQVFMQTLKKYNIPFTDKNYVEGALSFNDKAVYEQLLDNNPELDAVFCVNDNIALELYEVLEERGLVPGRDIMVLGYDNTVAGVQAKPPLASVWADPVKLGEEAVGSAVKLMNGQPAESEVIKTRFIKRSSFGEEFMDTQQTRAWLLEKESLDKCFDNIYYRYIYEELDSGIVEVRRKFHIMMDSLLDMFKKNSYTKEQGWKLQGMVDDFLNSGALEYADVDDLQSYFHEVYEAMKEAKGDKYQYDLPEFFALIYRKMLHIMEYRFGLSREQATDTNYSMKIFVQDVLSFERGNDQSYATLLANLNWLAIKNAYLYMFKTPIVHLNKEKFCPPEHLYLKAMLKDGIAQSVPVTYQQQCITDIFANEYMSSERSNMVLFPLFSNEMLYGVLLCDLTTRLFVNGEFLTNQMSSAVKMMELLKMNEMIQQQLEDNLVAMREHNIVLDNLSKSDSLTGIYNRRGFFDSAQQRLELNHSLQKNTLVAYADMNNLKIINDRYGHEEGDFSLQTISKILARVVGDKAIVGRIGGDEFAFVVEYQAEDNGDSLIKEITRSFQEFNDNSEKPYTITVSVGSYLLGAMEKLELKEALAIADERLYEMKQHRVKAVAKQEIGATGFEPATS